MVSFQRHVPPDTVSPGIPWFLLLAGNGMGLYIVGLALDVIPNDPSQWHVQRWVGVVAGLAFILAGWMPVASVARHHTRAGRVILALTVLALGVAINWMAFQPRSMVPAGNSPTLARRPGITIDVQTRSMPEKYGRAALVLLWDIPMAAFAAWLIFGGRRSARTD